VNYYERHIGDYLKDTAHLSLLEHGVYGRLLDVYYTREGAIPVEQVERLIGARAKDERAALSAVLDEFFTVADGMLHHSRCDREIARLQDKRRKASESANARWGRAAAQVEGNANALPDAMRTHMRTHSEGNARAPVPSHQTPDTTLVPKVQRGSAKGSRLPADWVPEPVHMAFAEGLGLRNGKATAELEKFRDYWAAQPGQKGVKTDWPATWRNWVRRAVENLGGKPGSAGSPDPFAGSH
jgi:uncharacterized protein YdaU (DUF1376 family)